MWLVTSSRKSSFGSPVNIDSGQIAFGVVIQDDSLRNFAALNARSLREIDEERVGIWKIIQLHGSNRPRYSVETITVAR